MKRVSTAMMLIGLVMLLLALGSDVAVDGRGGSRINNVGLMHDRLVNTILSGFVLLGGLLLKIFGANLNAGNGYLQAIDQLSASEYRLRLIMMLLVSGCLWITVVMYVWPDTLGGLLLLGAVGWFIFQPQATYAVLKRVWLAALVLTACVAAFHLVAITARWMNIFTYGVFSDGVELLGTGNFFALVGILILGPLLLSIAGFSIMAIKARRA